jgi:hypothetical protein
MEVVRTSLFVRSLKKLGTNAAVLAALVKELTDG